MSWDDGRNDEETSATPRKRVHRWYGEGCETRSGRGKILVNFRLKASRFERATRDDGRPSSRQSFIRPFYEDLTDEEREERDAGKWDADKTHVSDSNDTSFAYDERVWNGLLALFSVLIDASQKIGKLISNPKFLGMARKPSMFGALPESSERSEE